MIEAYVALIGAERHIHYIPADLDRYYDGPDAPLTWVFQIGNDEDAQVFAVEVDNDTGNFEQASKYQWKLTLEPVIEDEANNE